MLGEGPTFAINESFGLVEKKFSITFSKVNKKICLSLHYYNADNGCQVFFGKETFKFKADNKNVNFVIQLRLRSISNEFSATQSREVSLKGNVHDFSFDYNSIGKSDILSTQKYLMTKNNMK